MSEPKTAIWCSPHAFHTSARVGAHHLTRRLAERGWRVLFLSNPISPLHFAKFRNAEMHRRLAQCTRGISVEPSGIFTALPLTVLPFARRIGAGSRWMLQQWPQYTVPNLKRTLQRAGFDRPDLLVLDGPVPAPLVKLLRPKRSVLRILDRLSGFASTTPELLALTEEAAREVDLVTYSARDLAEEVGALNPKRAVHIGNGVDVAPFLMPRAAPAEYATIPSPRVVYVGTMAEWFDYELVAEAARQRPNIAFVLIGPAEVARSRLPNLPNLHLLGSRPWEEIGGYLQHANVGIVPFDMVNHASLVRGVNPIKLYEYAAAGLPIVSVHWPELARLEGPIALSVGREAFIAAIEGKILDPPAREVLRNFAHQHDWNSILDTLLRHAFANDRAGQPSNLVGHSAS
jgi:glycosyltransferase involved in cell wall biosynthesis